jgi:MFS superfamily sulfate permease-like transporter
MKIRFSLPSTISFTTTVGTLFVTVVKRERFKTIPILCLSTVPFQVGVDYILSNH